MVAASLLAILLIPAGFCMVETLAAFVGRKNRGQQPPLPDL